MKVEWQKFPAANGSMVEAQVFTPLGPCDNAILFCPGFPGAGATIFEQRHAAALVAAGYALVVIRHAGTRFDVPSGPSMINNAQRLREARQKGETMLGGGPATIKTWLEEPLPVLNALSTVYTNIHVIGNSFGAPAALWSLTDPTADLSRVRTLLLMAGAQGVSNATPLSVMRIWQPAFIEMARITEKVALEPGLQVAATLKQVYEDLPERVKTRIPEAVAIKYLVVKADEILALSDTEQFREAIGGRGEIIVNEIDRAYPAHGFLAHDMTDYKVEDLLILLGEKNG